MSTPTPNFSTQTAGNNPCYEKNPAEYINAFKNYLKAHDMYEIWKNVMDELKKILDWSLTKRARWSQKVEIMRGNIKIRSGKQTLELDERFRQRESLPTIFDVVK